MNKKKNKNKKINRRQFKTNVEPVGFPVQSFKKDVLLSQCMIVKNEEKHIERALGWAKDIAFEQIVVDTGSTDRTVDLAEKMGAKVHHFKWVNDFGAAKNYAMDLAKGNWIAILDADEYMPPEDADELLEILKKIQNDSDALKKYDGVQNSWVQLDDNDNITSILTNVRIFKNKPELRYKGKIHEVVPIINQTYNAINLRIMHTGYKKSIITDTAKTERNLLLLKQELKQNPDDPRILIYMADTITSKATEESNAEAEKLFLKALESDRLNDIPVKQLAYDFLIPRYLGDLRYGSGEKQENKALELCNIAIKELPENIDYRYFRAILNNRKNNYKEAYDDLMICQDAFLKNASLPMTKVLLPCPIPLFYQLKLSSEGMNDDQSTARNSTIIISMLTDSENDIEIIGIFIKSLLVIGVSEDDVSDELSVVYNFDDPKDLMFIARAAKNGGSIEYSRNITQKVGILLGRN